MFRSSRNMLYDLLFVVGLLAFSVDCHLQRCGICCDSDNDWSNENNDEPIRGPAGSPGKKGPKGEKGDPGLTIGRSNALRPNSCKEALENGDSVGNGVYYIEESNGVVYPVYCDMELDGGGWTLVASIHENNLRNSGRCTTGDRWSSEQGLTADRPRGDGNFENRNTFGQVFSATSDDYKNAGYFDIQARDVMIWEVPNDTPVNQFNSSSNFQYRTTNGFLAQYGSNLYNLYKIHFPIESGRFVRSTDNGPSVPVTFDRGTAQQVKNHFGPNTYPHIEGGYIQFRVLNGERDALALCPGTRAKASHHNAEQSCIGTTGLTSHINYCGDFSALAWNGYGTHVGWSASLSLVESTFMIFYR